MGDAGGDSKEQIAKEQSLGDYFAKTKKKKIKSSNLNNATTPATSEKAKAKAKDSEEDGWQQEEQVVTQMMKVEVAGKLTREEDKKEEEDTAAPAWGSVKKSSDKSESQGMLANEKRFPSLAKSVQSSNINIDDGSDNKVNISTSKNVFSALEQDNSDDEEGAKRPKVIAAAAIRKQKGEKESVAVKREVDKYKPGSNTEGAKKGKKDAEDDGEEGESDEGEEGDAKEAEEAEEEVVAEKKKSGRSEKAEAKVEKKSEAKVEEDLQIQPDLKASMVKYSHRRRLVPKDLPASEMEDEKENKPNKPKPGVKPGKKKWTNFEEEDDKSKRLIMVGEDF